MQRVPDTESQGRIHTSAVTVAVLPEVEEVDIKINPADVKVDVYRSSGPGGQRVKMRETRVHRGENSAGVTVAGESLRSALLIRIWADESVAAEATISLAKEAVMRAGGAIVSAETQDSYLRLAVNYEGDVPRLAEALLQTPGVVLHSIGETSEVIKDVGTPVVMDARHGISKISGTHGVGHVRMATESKTIGRAPCRASV